MNTEYLSFIAGTISSLIFVSSHLPMLWKAYKSKDLHSYSGLNIALLNVGNLIYWFYVIDLPVGPVWLMHTFYTISSGVLLTLFVRYHLYKAARYYIQRRKRSLLSYLRRIFTIFPNRHLHQSC
jgi:uncharacterized protein with PQ loop repeat